MFELLREVDSAKTRPAKILTLHKYSDKQLKAFLGYVFDSNIKWLVPEGNPPFTPSNDDPNLLRGRIWQDFRIIQHFTSTGPYPNMKPVKREELFINYLQSIHPEDAKLLLYIKDNRDVPFKSITRDLIEEAFPLLVAKWGKPIPPKEKPEPVSVITNPLQPSGDSSKVFSVEVGDLSQEAAEAAVREFLKNHKTKTVLTTEPEPEPKTKATKAQTKPKPKRVTKKKV